MREVKIGGSYQCRICGDINGCFPCNQKVLPLQAVQISIENIEDFFANSSMLVGTRKIFEGLFKELRILLGVPEEKIYSRKSLLSIDKLEEAFDGLSSVEKNKLAATLNLAKDKEEIKDKTFEYNPLREVLGRVSGVISKICDFAANDVYVTKLQEEPMMNAIYSLKNEVLKK